MPSVENGLYDGSFTPMGQLFMSRGQAIVPQIPEKAKNQFEKQRG